MAKTNDQQAPTPQLPPMMYTEFKPNFGEDEFTTAAQTPYDIQKYLDALLGKAKAQDAVLVVHASLVPAEFFINEPGEPEQGGEDGGPVQEPS